MSVLTVTKENFEETVLNSDKKVLVDFWASWCGPCKMLAPTVEEVAEERPEYLIGKINIDEQPELSDKYNIMSIPTLVVFEKGQEIKRSTGVIPKESILEMLL